MKGYVGFRDLSAWLKILVVLGWIAVAWYVFWFLIGFAIGFMEAII